MKYLIGLFLLTAISIGCKPTPTNTVAKPTFKNVDVPGAKQMMMANAELVLLDVRTPGEIAQGKIPNAKEIDFRASNFDSKIARLDKSKSYLVYCKSGGRSASASKKMIEAGFTDVTNMEGGFSAWK